MSHKYSVIGKYNDAIAILDKAVEYNKTASSIALRNLAYAAMGNLDKSFKDAEMAYSFDPNNGEAKSAISFCLYLKKLSFFQLPLL